jgi:hypothetical protein
MKNLKNTIRILGTATCLIAALLMAFGEPIVGVNHTGIATVVCIVGLGVIATGSKTSPAGKKKEGH